MGELITYTGGWQTLVVVRAPHPFAEAFAKLLECYRNRIAEPAVSKGCQRGEYRIGGVGVGHAMFPMALAPAISAL